MRFGFGRYKGENLRVNLKGGPYLLQTRVNKSGALGVPRIHSDS